VHSITTPKYRRKGVSLPISFTRLNFTTVAIATRSMTKEYLR
jgi:hypothetical protein